MHVPRSFLVEQRGARKIGIERGSIGTFDACSAGADRSGGLTPAERAGYDFAHDLDARDGFSGFAPGLEREIQGEMIARLFGAIAVAFARWSDSVSRCSHPVFFETVPTPVKAPRKARGKRKAMIDASERESIDGVSLVRLPTGGQRERRVTR